jgi:hypothetical protein
MPAVKMPPTLSQYFALFGGLDVESAQLAREPGLVMGSSNYESATESGYERIGGFEAFDGHPRPSDAIFIILYSDTGFSDVVSGDVVNGQTSGATGRVIQLRGTNELVLTRVVGTFAQGENIRIGVGVIGVFTRLADDFDSNTENTLSALAAADARLDIMIVPGSGAPRGIVSLNGVMYAFKDNTQGTALAIYKGTASGWQLVPLMNELAFTAGSGSPPIEGTAITKGSVTAIVRRVVLQSGSWGGGTAAGRFIIDTIANGPFTAGAFTAGVSATAGGASTPITLLPGGRLDARNYNFTGSTDTERVYGADGMNRGFEFDGVTLVPINTGMAVDTPRHVECHSNHLFFAFKGSVQHSSPGAPYIWSAVLGAAEIAIGSDVTNFEVLPGGENSGALLITALSRTLVLYGTSAADWKKATFSPIIGAQRWAIKNIGVPVVMDANGISIINQSQQFGNFVRTPLSNKIRRILTGRMVVATVVNRAKRRMRIFFSSGPSLTITASTQPGESPYMASGETLAFMEFDYGKTVTCTCEALINGEYRTFFGASDGYVYEADRGRSFDGTPIEYFIKLAFNFVKSPGLKKRFRWSDIEVKPQSAMTLYVQGEYSLGNLAVSLTNLYTKAVTGAGGIYDVSNWDQCYYDAPVQSVVRARLDGAGTSLSLVLYGRSGVELPHELQSVTNFYTPRRLERG